MDHAAIIKKLYKGIAGYSIGLQFEGSTYNFSRHCIAKSRSGRIGFEATEAELEENDLFSFHVRIPLLVGVQTPKRWISLQTGLGLYVGGSKYEYRFKGRDEMESHHFHTPPCRCTVVGHSWHRPFHCQLHPKPHPTFQTRRRHEGLSFITYHRLRPLVCDVPLSTTNLLFFRYSS